MASRKQLDEGELVNHVKEYLTDKNIINQFWICIIDPINSGLRITKFEASSISKCEKCNLVTRHTNLKVCISPIATLKTLKIFHALKVTILDGCN